jgi:acylphosphatase
MVAKHVFYEGRVQGVGFRFTVKQLARGFDITGSVRNLQDGRVELKVQGDSEEVAAFLEAIAESELKGHFKKVDLLSGEPDDVARGFHILP